MALYFPFQQSARQQHSGRHSPYRNVQRNPFIDVIDAVESGLRAFDVPDESGFRPKFNIRDFKDHYEITGEVPGLTKDNINIEVSDYSLSVSGSSEHLNTNETPDPRSSSQQQGRRKHQLQPSVEDEDADWTSASGATEGETTKTQEQQQQQQKDGEPSTEVAKKSSQTNVAQRPRSPQGRMIVTERTFGSFVREFRFRDKIYRAVTPTLEHGILKIVAKKILPEGPTRVTIQ